MNLPALFGADPPVVWTVVLALAWASLAVAHVGVARSVGVGWGRVGAVVGLFVAWFALAWGVLRPALPVSWMMPLHESVTQGRLQHAMGFGLSEDALVGWALGQAFEPWSLRTAIGILVVLHGAGVLFAAIALRHAGVPAWVCALGVAPLALPPTGWHMPLSATAASDVLALLMASVGPVVAGWRGGPSARRWAALAVFGAMPAFLGVRRAAILWWAAAVFLPWVVAHPRLRRLDDAVAAWLAPRRAQVLRAAAGAWLVAGAVAWSVDLAPSGPLGSAAWLVGLLHPFHVAELSLLPMGLALWPAGAVILVGVGIGRALARPLVGVASVGALALSWRAYTSAGHAAFLSPWLEAGSTWELYRYILLILPLAAVLGGVGLASLGPGRTRTVVLLACLLPPVPEAAWALRMHFSPAQAPYPRLFGVAGDDLRETQALTTWIEAGERCVVVSRALDWSRIAEGAAWVVLDHQQGFPHWQTVDSPPDAAPLDVLRAYAPDAPCGFAWWSLDCRRADLGCEAIAALPPIDPRVSVPGAPYVVPAHGVPPPRPLTFGAHALPGLPPRPIIP